MKAVLLAPEIAARDGGIQRILRLYLAALADDPRVTNITLVALNDTPAQLAALPLLAVSKISGKPLHTSGCSGSKAKFLRETWRHCAGARRVVCGHLAQLPVAALAARPGATIGLVAHGIEVWPRFSVIARLAATRAHHIFCVSTYTRDRIAAHHPGLEARAIVVPNAIDPAVLSTPPPEPPPAGRPPVILCVGRLSASDFYKGYDLLLRAFARLPAPSAPDAPRLRYVGDGDDRPRLELLARDLGVSDRVEFSGRLTDPELLHAFADCTCFALPSTGEGFGLVYLEALAAGRPCVGVAATAVPELITPDAGLLARPNDPADLAEKLAACLSHSWSPAALREIAMRYHPVQFARRLRAAWESPE